MPNWTLIWDIELGTCQFSDLKHHLNVGSQIRLQFEDSIAQCVITEFEPNMLMLQVRADESRDKSQYSEFTGPIDILMEEKIWILS
jgi:hypothetical protein